MDKGNNFQDAILNLLCCMTKPLCWHWNCHATCTTKWCNKVTLSCAINLPKCYLYTIHIIKNGLRPYLMIIIVFKTSYFCMWIHVCTSFLIPYNASMYRFLWHLICILYTKRFVCVVLKTNQGVPFVFSLHTNVCVQILSCIDFHASQMLLAHPRMRLQSSPLDS